jgi:hypothetical protein
LNLGPLPYRSIQVGITKASSGRYCDAWIARIRDVTPLVRQVQALVEAGRPEDALPLLPEEREYPVSAALAATIGLQPAAPAAARAAPA